MANPIYNEKSEIIHQKGETLTPNIILKLSYIKIYKKDKSLSSSSVHEPAKRIVTPIKDYQRPKLLIPEKTSEKLIKNTRQIFNKTFEGDALKYSECAEVSNIILEEVTEKYKNLDSIEQLRVYDEYTYSHNINVSSISIAFGVLLGLKENESRRSRIK